MCIIGAGSSGIAAAQLLYTSAIPFDCFEKGSEIGGTWLFDNPNGTSACYETLQINTSCPRMAFSDFPMPEHYPHYASHDQVFDYFRDYVDHFGFGHTITFNTEVTDVRRGGRGGRGGSSGRGEPGNGGSDRSRENSSATGGGRSGESRRGESGGRGRGAGHTGEGNRRRENSRGGRSGNGRSGGQRAESSSRQPSSRRASESRGTSPETRRRNRTRAGGSQQVYSTSS